MSARAGVPGRLSLRTQRARAGVSLIEVVVACSLLALTFTSLTALTARLAQRNRSNAYGEQRTATFFEPTSSSGVNSLGGAAIVILRPFNCRRDYIEIPRTLPDR